jgi:surface protein
MYNQKINKSKKRKQKKSRKTKKQTNKQRKQRKQRKYLGGDEVYTPTDPEEMRTTIKFYNKNGWNDEIMKNFPQYKGPIGSWNVSNIKDMSMMFFGCATFNESLNDWDVSNVENMSSMFENCLSFDQPLDNWDVSNVRDMTLMFFDCSDFSKNLDSWTTKLTNLQEMKDIFYGCDNFDKQHFIRKFYQESFETDDELYEMFEYDYIFFLITRYNKYKNIENFTICDAIYLYNHVLDNYINGILRNNNEIEIKETLTPKFLEFLEKIIHTIDDYFINKAPKSHEGMGLYRGEQKLCEGDTCRMGVISSYTSTSKDPNVPYIFTNKVDCCSYIYVLEEGIPYIYVDEIMKKDNQYKKCRTKLKLKNDDEHEVILPRGIILNKMKEQEETLLQGKRITTFMMSISYDKNYIKNNPINF